MSEETTSDATPQRRSWMMALPLIAFMALAALFWLRLGDGDPSRIPSALIGHPAPQTALPALEGLAALVEGRIDPEQWTAAVTEPTRPRRRRSARAA